MSEQAYAYVPLDRRVAVDRGSTLPSDVRGSALEADLSGFTALTEGLAERLGEQRGAEELARRLNVLYDGLLTEAHAFGATVLGFSGDAFTCWFDGDDGAQATACAEALQDWMAAHALNAVETLAADLPAPKLKVAVATGSARRYLVGDPSIQLIEGLAGSLVDELAEVEHGAEPGEVVLAESTRRSLGERAQVGARGVLERHAIAATRVPWPDLREPPEGVDAVRSWLLGPVFTRLAVGAGEFVAELRPATALFLRFGGIRFDSDPDALAQLDRFVSAVQQILRDVEGSLIQLTIGDKGAYLYAVLGAPVAHEDDRARALLVALRLRALGDVGGLVDPVSIGIASGRLRVGSYGGAQRRTYGVLGDTVNLAARLMQAAGPGEILATAEVRDHTGEGFEWAEHAELTVKGKRLPVAVATLVGAAQPGQPAARPVSVEDGAMLGRGAELASLLEDLDSLGRGRGRVVSITGEAGLGKSRLVAEFVAVAAGRGTRVVQGLCPSYGTSSSYAGWRSIWTHLLGLDAHPAADRVDAVAPSLARADAALAARAGLLGPLLDLAIPDDTLIRGLDAKTRKTALEATLIAWLQAAVTEPLVLVVEDCHWIDALSEDLLHSVGKAVRALPILVVVTQRPRGDAVGGELSVASLPQHRTIALDRLSDADVDDLIAGLLGRTPLTSDVAEAIRELSRRAEGNPFFVREIAGYVAGLGDHAGDPARLAEMPSSLQSLVLSRIDRLAEQPRVALRVASVVGRSFQTSVLAPVQPELGDDHAVVGHVSVLVDDGFVVPDESTLAYSFVHAVTQEVAYSTITTQTRAALHGRIGRVLEGRSEPGALDLLAYHFGRSDDDARRARHVYAAAEAARGAYANDAAVAYYRNVLPVLAGEQRHLALLDLGRVLALTSQWAQAQETFVTAQAEARSAGEQAREAWAQLELAEVLRKQGRFEEALPLFDEAGARLGQLGDDAGLAEVLHLQGTLAAQRGDRDAARASYRRSLELRTALGDRRGMARSLNGLGIVAEYDEDLAAAAELYAQAQAILTELGDTWGRSALINNAGMVLLLQDDPAAARPLFEEAVRLQRVIGDRLMLSNFLSNLGDSARELDDLPAAAECYRESLHLADEVDELWLIAYLLEDVAMLAAAQGRGVEAITLTAAADRLRTEIGTPLPAQARQRLDARLDPARAEVSAAEVARAQARGAGFDTPAAVQRARDVITELIAQDSIDPGSIDPGSS